MLFKHQILDLPNGDPNTKRLSPRSTRWVRVAPAVRGHTVGEVCSVNNGPTAKKCVLQEDGADVLKNSPLHTSSYRAEDVNRPQVLTGALSLLLRILL